MCVAGAATADGEKESAAGYLGEPEKLLTVTDFGEQMVRQLADLACFAAGLPGRPARHASGVGRRSNASKPHTL